MEKYRICGIDTIEWKQTYHITYILVSVRTVRVFHILLRTLIKFKG